MPCQVWALLTLKPSLFRTPQWIMSRVPCLSDDLYRIVQPPSRMRIVSCFSLEVRNQGSDERTEPKRWRTCSEECTLPQYMPKGSNYVLSWGEQRKEAFPQVSVLSASGGEPWLWKVTSRSRAWFTDRSRQDERALERSPRHGAFSFQVCVLGSRS